MGKMIYKKILPEFYREVASGNKAFEIRKDEDDVQVGDLITLREWDGKRYTGCSVLAKVSYVLRDAEEYGLMSGYCIIGLRNISMSLEIGG